MRATTEIMIDLDAARRDMADYRRNALEGGEGYNPHERRVDRLAAEMTHAEHAEQDAEWTVEVTVARRAAWNALVHAAGARPNITKLQEQAGYELAMLKRQVQRHAL